MIMIGKVTQNVQNNVVMGNVLFMTYFYKKINVAYILETLKILDIFDILYIFENIAKISSFY